MALLTPEEMERLTPPERLSLISQLWDSLGHEQLPVTPAQQAELDHRLGTLDEDRKTAVTWALLKAGPKNVVGRNGTSGSKGYPLKAVAVTEICHCINLRQR